MRGWEDINKLNTNLYENENLLFIAKIIFYKYWCCDTDIDVCCVEAALLQATTPGMGTHSYLTSESHQTTTNLTICSHHQLHEN